MSLPLFLVEIVGRPAGVPGIGQRVREQPAAGPLDAADDVAPGWFHARSVPRRLAAGQPNFAARPAGSGGIVHLAAVVRPLEVRSASLESVWGLDRTRRRSEESGGLMSSSKRLIPAVAAAAAVLVAAPSAYALNGQGSGGRLHAAADSYRVRASGTLTVPAGLGVLANDSGGPLQVISNTNPAHG